MNRSPNVIWLFCIVLLVADVASVPRKQLAGPPSEFALNTLPDTSAGSLTSEYASHFIFLNQSHNEMVWETDLTVDSSTNYAFFMSSPHAKDCTLTLTNEKTGKNVKLPDPVHDVFPIGLNSVPVDVYKFGNTLAPGIYTIKVTGPATLVRNEPLEADGLLISYNESPVKIYSTLMSYSLLKGEKVGVRAMLYDSKLSSPREGVTPQPVLFTATQARLEVEFPNGTDVTVDMHDDGLHDDMAPNDGIFGATLEATQAGRYIAEPKLLGSVNGAIMARSTIQLFNVVDLPFSVKTEASGVTNSDNKLKIYIPVGEDVDKTLSFRPYAEVWGKSTSGEDVAVCWISTISSITDFAGAPHLEMELDLNWLKLANAQEPLTLKQFYVQEVDYFLPLIANQTISVKTKEPLQPLVNQLSVTEITKEMREGKPPARKNSVKGEKGKLVLVHGYCSNRNPWKESPKDWTEAAYFLNPNASLSNNAFAQKVADFAQNFESFGLIGHSQGGLVGVHLHNYYFTGLESATGGRLVQTLGSPFHGDSVAGVVACLASIFGVGCGSNTDLTRDGAALWLKGITAETKKDIYYFTTRYPDTGKQYCNQVLNLILRKPNDGLAELPFTSLDGGNDMGTTPGWCHTEGMEYTAQYYDHDRNKAMNAAAAR